MYVMINLSNPLHFIVMLGAFPPQIPAVSTQFL